jgi:hypothetical protein
VPQGQNERHGERADKRAELVERLMDREPPAVAHMLCCVGEHRVPGRVARCLTDSLQYHQQRCNLPAAGEGEQRHDRHLECVAADRDRPVDTGAVCAPARHQPQAVPEELTEAGDDGDRECPSPEGAQVRPDDGARALVGKVREEAHHAHRQDEPERYPRHRRPGNWRRFSLRTC